MLKIVAAVRRKPGMTHAEFIDYIVNVHGQIARAEPVRLKRYIQNHVDDGAFGSKHSAAYAMPFHRDNVTELYFDSAADMAATFGHEYTRTVVGPDGANFAELSTNEATLTNETIVSPPTDRANTVKIMHFLVAHSVEQVAVTQDTWGEAHDRAMRQAPLFAAALRGTTRSDAIAPPPGSPVAAYFGGEGRAPLAVIASHWVAKANASTFRDYDDAISASGCYDPERSYYLVTKEVEIFPGA